MRIRPAATLSQHVMRGALVGVLIVLCNCGSGESAKTGTTTEYPDILITTSGTLIGLLVELQGNSILFRIEDGEETTVARDEARVATFEVRKPSAEPKNLAALQPFQDTVFMRDGTLHSGFVSSITLDTVVAAGRSLNRPEVHQIVFAQEAGLARPKPPVDEEDPAGRCWAGEITIGQKVRHGEGACGGRGEGAEAVHNVERHTEMEIVLEQIVPGLLTFREVRYRIGHEQRTAPRCQEEQSAPYHVPLTEEWQGHWKKEDLPRPEAAWLAVAYKLEGKAKVTYLIEGRFLYPPFHHFKGSSEVPEDPRRALPPEVSLFGRMEQMSSGNDQDGTPHADPESLVFQGRFEIEEKDGADRSTVTASWDLKPGPCKLPD